MERYDEETDVSSHYNCYVQTILVSFDDWIPDSTISIHSLNYWRRVGRCLGRLEKVNSTKVFRWEPLQPEEIVDDLIIKYAKDRRERFVKVSLSNVYDQGTYDRKGDARIEVKRKFRVGAYTIHLKVHRVQFYKHSKLNVNIALQFANGGACIHFIQQDMSKLRYRKINIGRRSGKDEEQTLVGIIVQTLVPLTHSFWLAQADAIQRGLLRSQLEDVYRQPETRLIHVRHTASSHRSARLCNLMLRLNLVFDTFPESYIHNLECNAISIAPTSSLHPCPFRFIHNLHLDFAAYGYQDHNCRSSLPAYSDNRTSTATAIGVQCLTAANSVFAGNSVTMGDRSVPIRPTIPQGVTVNINYIAGDSYFGAISGSNNGGRNNVNTIRIRTPVLTSRGANQNGILEIQYVNTNTESSGENAHSPSSALRARGVSTSLMSASFSAPVAPPAHLAADFLPNAATRHLPPPKPCLATRPRIATQCG
ncbi:hypothetical protein EYR38_010336 [Pleurotus pulmonarius]|nr:hypothetical protein EYR38_010336 [Pleurotus pulmonarius]